MNTSKAYEEFIRNQEDTRGFLCQRIYGYFLDHYLKICIEEQEETDSPHVSDIIIIRDKMVFGTAEVVQLKTIYNINHYYKYRSIPCMSLMAHVIVQYPDTKHVILPNGIFAINCIHSLYEQIVGLSFFKRADIPVKGKFEDYIGILKESFNQKQSFIFD